MGSPFRKYVNLYLYYEVASGEYAEDAYGIPRPSGTITKTVAASVDEGSFQPSGKSPAGPDTDRIYIEGYLVNPKQMPSDFPISQVFRAKMIDPLSKLEFNGEFELEGFVPQRIKAVSKVLGSAIKGYFISVGGG